jgi:hypothetical protein
MRKIGRFLCCTLLALTFVNTSFAQGMKDPTHWTYESKKIANDVYELNFKLKLDEGFHIWAINVGGDGFQIVPKFYFDKTPKAKWMGNIREKGKLMTESMEGIEGKVNYYSREVTYTQMVQAPAGSTINGKHEYQVCNNFMCLPPTDKPFSFQLN